MEFGAILSAAGASVLVLSITVVWLAFRLQRKNRQLRRALAELQRHAKKPAAAPQAEATPIATFARPSPIPRAQPDPAPPLDAFLWEHLGDAFLWKHLSSPATPAKVPESLPVEEPSIPIGLSDRAALQPLLAANHRFIGLVVLVGIDRGRIQRQAHPAEPFIEGLLSPTDFACRNSDDEFLIICPGLRGAEAQRRLNEISERLWNFQLRGQGSFSVLFSWGGIGDGNESLSDAIASASGRMKQTKRSRVILFRRKAG